MGDTISLLGTILCSIGCYGMAAVFFQGKGASLIAGYNTADEAEQRRYDTKKLCKGAGVVSLTEGIALTVMTVGIALTEEWKILPEWTMLAVGTMFVVVTLGVVTWYLIYANTRCKRQNEQEEMK